MAHSLISDVSIRQPLKYLTSPSLQISCFRCCCVRNRSSLFSAPIHGRLQLSQTYRKLQKSCNSLRLGAAEEGVSSWEEKLESTSSSTGFHEHNEDDLKGGRELDVNAWRDSIVDEEGNIDNIEQEYMRDGAGLCEGSLAPMASEESESSAGHSRRGYEPKKAKEWDVTSWRDSVVDKEGNIDNIEQEYVRDGVGVAEEMSAAMASEESKTGSCADQTFGGHHHHSHLPICDTTSQNFGSTTDVQHAWEGPRTRTMDWRLMAETNHNDWPGENSIREGDMGEANAGDVDVLPSSQQGGVPPSEFQEREKYGWSEASCDEGSLLLRKNSQERNGVSEAVPEQKLEESTEEKVFREDTGRTPDDYHRRADLFGKSAERFVADKHVQEERESAQ